MNNISDGFTICIFFITVENMSENQNEMEIFKVQRTVIMNYSVDSE
jgi:hypothetical protein